MSRLHGWKPKPKFTAGLNVSQEEWDRIFGISEREYERVSKLMAEPPPGWERCEPTKDNPYGERPSQQEEHEKYYLHSKNFGKNLSVESQCPVKLDAPPMPADGGRERKQVPHSTNLSGTSQEGATPSTEAGGSNPQRSDADGVTVNGEPAAQSSLTSPSKESKENP
jgi:hypothetical protein